AMPPSPQPASSPRSASASSAKPTADEAEAILRRASEVARENAKRREAEGPKRLGQGPIAAAAERVAVRPQVRRLPIEESVARRERTNRMLEANSLCLRLPPKYRNVPAD